MSRLESIQIEKHFIELGEVTVTNKERYYGMKL